MSTNEAKTDAKPEFDDSGCIQDVGPPKPEAMENGYVGQAQLLDLSDDVLLYILRYCSPHDLKALGFTCARFGSLVLERSLWNSVDARGVCTSRPRMRWLLQALHSGTREVLLHGYAEQARGCRGHVNRTRKEVEDEQTTSGPREPSFTDYIYCGNLRRTTENSREAPQAAGPEANVIEHPPQRQQARLLANAQQLPRQSSSPSWPEDCEWEGLEGETMIEESSDDTAGCAGPVFTLSPEMIKELHARCPKLTSLSLEYCNINCNKINPSNFPPTLKRLSLRGTRCYNPPLDKTYLFRIHDYVPDLEYLDLSECAWLEPAVLLPLSKLPRLKVLLMRECPAMAEFVAYVSLATRYGFRVLQVFDLRGSPVGDSEVSALGWLPALREVYLSAPGAAPAAPAAPASPAPHHHYIGDPLPRRPQLDDWEMQLPDYYKERSCSESESPVSEGTEDVDAQVRAIRRRLKEMIEDPANLQMYDLPTPREQSNHVPTDPDPNDDEQGQHEEQEINEGRSQRSGEGSAGGGGEGNGKGVGKKSGKGSPKKRKLDDDEAGSSKRSKKKKKKDDKRGDKRVTIKIQVKSDKNHEDEKDSDKSLEENDTGKDDKSNEEDSPSSSPDKNSKLKYKFYKSKNKVDEEAGPSNADDTKKDERSESKGKSPIKATKTERPEPRVNEGASGSRDNVVDDGILLETSRSPRAEANAINRIKGHTNWRDLPARPDEQGNTKYEYKIKYDGAARFSRFREDTPPRETGYADDDKQTYRYKIAVNDGASTSQYSIKVRIKGPAAKKARDGGEKADEDESSEDDDNDDDGDNNVAPPRIPAPSGEGPSWQPDAAQEGRNPAPAVEEAAPRSVQQFVRFRRNQPPVVVRCPARNQRHENLLRMPEQAEPRHHVLYVNLGQQLHAVYRLLPNRPFINSSRNRFTQVDHLDSSSLVTDSAITRFGRAVGEEVLNVVNLGPVPQFGGRDTTNGRPNVSPLRILSATGYSNITNRSLVHLATSAPHLQVIDFSNTGVTEEGVERFKTLRPDVEVKFSTFVPDREQNEE